MSAFIVLGVIALIVFAWVSRTRTARKNWLKKLDLPGLWDLQGNENTSFEFIGDLHGGNYIYSLGNSFESGSWQISGNTLLLKPNDAQDSTELELRVFEFGEIGIHGPGKEHQIYRKRLDNVVQMRPRS